MSDTDNIDAAVVAKLEDDATLRGIMGFTAADQQMVFFEIAPAGVTKFILVFQEDHEDEYSMNERAFETPLYVVMACVQATTTSVAKSAGQRIYALLHDKPLTITGYRHMHTLRRGRIRETKAEDDTDIRWQHRGGRYEVRAAPNT